ncbi:16S rRNA (guanine(527)-N(7))-methyltransferase RsmG [Candidatus Phytoplasma fraxini]|uniref:Ribosomal RNA small subunit methyltransferase G n=1 Tax=Ash yellows phytoplasma TaxID=35780 RepID=A0ABZ2U945_ASHYP
MLFEKLLVKDFGLNTFQVKQFRQYYLFLKQYNQKINLTSLTTEKDIYFKHFYDSLLVSKVLNLNQINNLFDLGTGAGFPGIPLKILYPNLKIFLIDSSSKKTVFLELLINHLKLLDVFVFKEKIENHPNKYDCVITRALGKIELILKLASLVVVEHGYFIVMKGPNYERELQNIKKNYHFKLKQKFFFELPEKLGKRVNLLFQKKI